MLFVVKGKSKFWKVKERKVPECLQKKKYGEHKYLKIKVFIEYFVLYFYGSSNEFLFQNIKLHYVENGDMSKPIILFLHGFPDIW